MAASTSSRKTIDGRDRVDPDDLSPEAIDRVFAQTLQKVRKERQFTIEDGWIVTTPYYERILR